MKFKIWINTFKFVASCGSLVLSFPLLAILSAPLKIDEGQPALVSSSTATCNTTSYPFFLSTHIPMVSKATTSDWNKNKQGTCLQTQRAQILQELGQGVGPVVQHILHNQNEQLPQKKEKKEEEETSNSCGKGM